MTETELLQRAETFIQINKQAMVDDMAALIAFPSIEGEAVPGAPYGVEVRKALDWTLARAAEMGFATKDGDGYVGWAELPGKEEAHVATISHLDVVPVADGWDADPWTLREREGWLIGRGVSDDKGPSILCLYLAKFFKELGVPLRYGLRVLFGCSEETGMTDVDYYVAHNPQPAFCFTPDTSFPLCHAEKGVMGGNFVSAPLAGNILEFYGGIASNVIPDSAYCVVKADPATLQNTDRVTVTAQDGNARLDAKGIAGHAAWPVNTVNAIGLLVDYLLENNLCTQEENRFLTLQKQLHGATDGSGIGIAASDDIFSPLTCVGGMVRFEKGRLSQNINIRFPTTTSGDALTAALQAKAGEFGAAFEATRPVAEPFVIAADHPAIQALLSAYNETSGKDAKPYAMGGGTYARHFERAVAFGPAPEEVVLPPFAGTEHAANEGANLADMLQALKIYILAVWRLQEVDL